MDILILGAGYGTRLYPLIKDTPKPLLPVADRPLIDHTLRKLEAVSDVRRVIVVTNDKFYGHFKHWAQNDYAFRWPVVVVNDHTTCPENRLGSVGDIDFVLQQEDIRDDLLIIGGDNIFDFNLKDYLEFSRDHCRHISIGLYDIGHVSEASKFGVVAIDPQHRVISFEEKPAQPKSSLIAMCCYFLPAETLDCVNQYLKSSDKSDKAGDFIRWLSMERTVYGFQFQGTWFDIGSIEAYHAAQKRFGER